MLAKTGGILVMAAALLLGGCMTQPIQNVQAPVTTTKQKPTMDEVRQAIVRAGSSLGWQIKPEKPGHLTGTLALRTHVAVVDIDHKQTQDTNKYSDSTNHDKNDGQINKN
jgi:hypothetical protein